MRKKTQLWVDTDFKKKLKSAAAKEGMPLLKYTKKLAREIDEKEKKEFKDVFRI